MTPCEHCGVDVDTDPTHADGCYGHESEVLPQVDWSDRIGRANAAVLGALRKGDQR